ncbi:UbiA family prenyltransferase [Rhodoblastus sp.]|uniref:UbiA family prenyltransferase n=1 Tax=Rhodoblastus sp. TaxID=1962975 RepID=UPI003F981434
MTDTMANLPSRLWTYQAERFPLLRTAALVAVFSSASIAVCARLGGRDLPPLHAFAVAFVVVLILFFQMRACDEFKDHEDDCRYRPERAVPRGLVTLREVGWTAAMAGAVALFAALSLGLSVAGLLLLVWAWLALMTKEFFAPQALRRLPLVYLVSHMLIMPLIDLFVTGCEWAARGLSPPPFLWLFLSLSFVNGSVLEIGRKVWTPSSEREGVETYSALWGARRAATVFAGCVVVSFLLLCGVGLAEHAFWPVASVGLVGFGAVMLTVRDFLADSTPATQARIESMSGLWVFVCYATAAFLPRLGGPA